MRITRSIARLAPLAFLALGGCHTLQEIGLVPTPPPPRGPSLAPRESTWTPIGSSVRGKPILATTVGTGTRRVYIIGGIHGNEPEGIPVAQALPALLAAADPPVLELVTFRIVQDMNPDGTATSSRTNTRGVDLNRNWPASNYRPEPRHGARPVSELETVAVHNDITAFDPDLVIVFHASHRGPFVNYDGNGAHLAYNFAAGAREHDPRWRVVHEIGYPTPGSLGTYAGVDHGTPILTVEFQRGRDAQTNTRAGVAGILAAVRPVN